MAGGEFKRGAQEAVCVVEPFHKPRESEHSSEGEQSKDGQVADCSVCGGEGIQEKCIRWDQRISVPFP